VHCLLSHYLKNGLCDAVESKDALFAEAILSFFCYRFSLVEEDGYTGWLQWVPLVSVTMKEGVLCFF